ncbi:MAG: ATP-binding protein [Vicinamibacterales bacterium]
MSPASSDVPVHDAALRDLNAELERRVQERTRELEVSRERFNEAQRIAHIGSWEFNHETSELFRSAELCRILGLPLDQADQFSPFVWDRVHPDDRERLYSNLRRTLDTGAPTTFEVRAWRPDGAERLLHMSSRAHRDATSGQVRLMGTVQDVTQQRATERELHRRGELLLQSQKMEAVGVLAGGVAHDFNNMLTVIRGQAEQLRRAVSPSDPSARRLDAILVTADRAAALTAQLLAVGCKQPHQPQAVDLAAVVVEADEMLARLDGPGPSVVQCVRARAPGPRTIWADPEQIHQLVVNLVVNARDAMPTGGTITLATGGTTIDEALASRFAANPGDYITLSVRDEGVGMDADVRAHLFEPFFTTKPMGKGTGLGLSAVYGIVKQSGGFIDVQSAPGLGTTVIVHFPAFAEAVNATAEPGTDAPRADRAPATRTILLAEDEDEVRDLVTDYLQAVGYRVLAGSDGAAALARARGYEGYIDLLLTDVVMPVMGGPELADRLVAEHPEARVLFMSGFAPEGLASFRAGVPLLRKPFSLDALGAAVRESLGD